MRLYSHDPYRTRRADAPQLDLQAGHEVPDRPLRVLAWVDRYPPYDNAGGEWALHHMLRHLVRQGHQVDVATRPTDDGCVLDGVRVHHDREAPRLLDQADVLVGHLFFTREVVHAAALQPVPLVYIFHNTFTVEHWNLTPNNVTAAVWNACWVRDHVTGEHSAWAQVPSATVRPPVLMADYLVPASGHDRAAVTIVNPNPDKGGEVFYRVAEALHQHRFLAVEGAYGQQLRPRTEHRNVTWHRQTADMRGDVYARTRVVLMPSRYESWGRVAVEAMCSGIPVVAHPTPGLCEALGDAGIYVDRRDVAGWVAAVRALDDPELYAERSAAASARAAHLDAQARSDLAAFDLLVRAAATAVQVPSGPMVTPTHDPYAPHRVPVTGSELPDDTPPADDEGAPLLAGEVPTKADDVVAWIRDADDDVVRYDRAAAAEYVEQRRQSVRSTVQAAYDPVLYTDGGDPVEDPHAPADSAGDVEATSEDPPEDEAPDDAG